MRGQRRAEADGNRTRSTTGKLSLTIHDSQGKELKAVINIPETRKECWAVHYSKKNKWFLTYHSSCYLPGEGHHVLRGYAIVFIVAFNLFFVVQGLNALKCYIDAAVRSWESDVDLANIIYTRPAILQVLWTKITSKELIRRSGHTNSKDKMPPL